MPTSAEKKSLRNLLRESFRRRWLFFVTAWLVAITVLVLSHFAELKYTGTAILRRTMDPAAWDMARDFAPKKETIQTDLKGFNAVRAAVLDPELDGEFGFTKGMPRDRKGNLTPDGEKSLRDVVLALRRTVKIIKLSATPQVDEFAVEFTDSNPRLASKMPDKLASNYKDQVRKRIIDGLRESKKFLDGRVDQARRSLSGLHKQLAAFEKEHGGARVDQPGVLQDRMTRIRSELAGLRRELTVSKEQRESLRANIRSATGPASRPVKKEEVWGPNPELTRLKDELREAKEQLDELRKVHGMTEEHPTVRMLRRKVEQLEERIQNSPEKVLKQETYAKMDPALAQIRLEFLENNIRSLESEMTRRENTLSECNALHNQYAKYRQDYLDLIKRMKDADDDLKRWQKRQTELGTRLEREMAGRGTKLEIVRRPQEQFRPSKPSLLMIVAFAIVGGLAAGGGLVSLRNKYDPTISTVEDAAKRFSVPVHGEIPEIVTRRRRLMRCLGRWTIGPAVVLVLLAGLSLAGLSITLRLRYPREYDLWRKDPIGFVHHDLVQQAGERMKSWAEMH